MKEDIYIDTDSKIPVKMFCLKKNNGEAKISDKKLRDIVSKAMKMRAEQLKFVEKIMTEYNIAGWIAREMQLNGDQEQKLRGLLQYGLDNVCINDALEEMTRITPDDFEIQRINPEPGNA